MYYTYRVKTPVEESCSGSFKRLRSDAIDTMGSPFKDVCPRPGNPQCWNELVVQP